MTVIKTTISRKTGEITSIVKLTPEQKNKGWEEVVESWKQLPEEEDKHYENQAHHHTN